jgi:hypothetical protein
MGFYDVNLSEEALNVGSHRCYDDDVNEPLESTTKVSYQLCNNW